MQTINHPSGANGIGWIVLTAAAVVIQAGCSSPLTTVALREFLRESTMTLAIDSDANEASKPDADDPEARPGDDGTAAGADADGADAADAGDGEEDISVERRTERSLERLARTTGFDQVARDVLVDTLEKAAPEDWPAIIDSFAASLEASPPRPASAAPASAPAGEADSQKGANRAGGLTIPVAESIPVAEPVGQIGDDDTSKEQEGEASEPQESPEELVSMLKQRLAEARRNAPLTVRRGCFASKVRGWGNLDTFDEPSFVPGQDVLVYFELDNLDGIENDRGFTTKVEAGLRLLDADGDVVKDWSFPLVEDRADSPRTDYFVRYLVRIPTDAAAGPHRLEASLTDAVSSKTATTSLDLEVVPEAAGRTR